LENKGKTKNKKNNKYKYRKGKSKKKSKEVAFINQSTLMSAYGLSKAMIEKYFPEPILKKNPYYPSQKPMKCWTEAQVNNALTNPNLQRLLTEKRAKQERKKERQRLEKEKLVNYLQLFDVEQYRIKAEMKERHFTLHIGPTNSGKTYEAIQALKECKKGAYLGPLRLLALEMFDTLNEQGCLCELLTGEEYVEMEGAYITSSTIELCDYYEDYDVCVIDEAQMIADPFRGDRWTKAIYLVNAKEVHICLAPNAEPLIRNILDGFGAEYDVKYHERLAPLTFEGRFNNISDAQPGDALITFSRKNVLATAAELQEKGIKASVIYGALPPVSRREEVRKFAQKENTVVVATDAIGMGISLPIKRVIFLDTTKYDGNETRDLLPEEVKQIAGRAGRFGIYDCGEVLTMYRPELIKEKLNTPSEYIDTITIPFPEEACRTDYPLKKLLTEWQNLEVVPGFKRTDMSEAISLLDMLEEERTRFRAKGYIGYKGEYVGFGSESLNLNLLDISEKELIYRLITCPVDTKDNDIVKYWLRSALSILDSEMPRMPYFDTHDLEGCEKQYKALDVRHQILRQIGIEEDSMEEKMILCDKINKLLLKNKRDYLKRCRICSKVIPSTYQYGICEKCYKTGRMYW